jgi:hypothetical protein
VTALPRAGWNFYFVGFGAERTAEIVLPPAGAPFTSLSFFGFFGSRPLRFCPLAMISLPFWVGAIAAPCYAPPRMTGQA